MWGQDLWKMMRERKSQAMLTTTKTTETRTKDDLQSVDLLLEWLVVDDKNKKFINELLTLRQSGEYQNILIMWKTGVWKTFVAKRIFDKSYFMDEQTFKQLLVAQQLTVRPQSEITTSLDYFPLDALLKKSEVLYDDFWIAEPTPAYIEKCLYFLKRVDDPKKKTIFTTNLSMEQIEKRDARIASRIMKNCKVIYVSGDDRRISDIQFIKA